MYNIDLILEEGEVGKYRVLARSVQREQALTGWLPNADAAMAAFGQALRLVASGALEGQIIDLATKVGELENERIAERATKAAKTQVAKG